MGSTTRVALMTGFWVLSAALMTVYTFADHTIRGAAGWSILSGMVGMVFTGWHLLVRERCRVEHIASIAATAACEHKGLESI